MKGSTDNILNRKLKFSVVEKLILLMWLSLGQTVWDMDGLELLCAVGSLHKYPKLPQFTLGEMNYHKPRTSPAVSYLFLPNPLFREDDWKSLWLMLPFDELNTLTHACLSLPPYSTPPPAPETAEGCEVVFHFFSLLKGGMG